MKPITEVKAGNTYKLIDKERWINNHNMNSAFYKHFTNDEVTIESLGKINNKDGVVGDDIIIDYFHGEYKYFTEVITEDHPTESPAEAKRYTKDMLDHGKMPDKGMIVNFGGADVVVTDISWSIGTMSILTNIKINTEGGYGRLTELVFPLTEDEQELEAIKALNGDAKKIQQYFHEKYNK